jgi:dUTP pyrophosphatase
MTENKTYILTYIKEEALLPTRATRMSSGFDLCADIEETVVLPAGKSLRVPTGVRFALPVGWEVQIRSRSGLAYHHQVVVLNSPGTIDADYVGEIMVVLINHSERDYSITPKSHIAQAVFAKAYADEVNLHVVLKGEPQVISDRGDGGFGSTGV